MFPKFCRKLRADRSGATAIMIAVMAAALIGFTSLGVEVVQALETQRHMQAVADSAALSAANAQIVSVGSTSGCGSACVEEAYALAAKSGFSLGQTTACTSTSPQVYVGPPCDGPNVGIATYVEVRIEAPFTLQLAHVVFPGNFTLHGRAVAHAFSTNPDCTLSLLPTGTGVSFNGNNEAVNYNNCSVGVDSTSANAANIGNGCLNATTINVGGSPGYSVGPNGQLTAGSNISATCASTTNAACTSANSNCVSGAPPALNPYADLTVPSPSGGTVKKGIATPGSYTANSFKSATEMCPGVYVVTGSLKLTGSSGLTSLSSVVGSSDYDSKFATDCPGSSSSTGVTLFIKNGDLSLAGNGTVILTPPTSGTYAGLVLYDATGSFSNAGNATTNLTGAVVFPQGEVDYVGNGTDNGALCTEIIASTIKFTGNAALGANCAGFGTKPILQPAILVE